jgi:Flp pilus assembly pilin Flp
MMNFTSRAPDMQSQAVVKSSLIPPECLMIGFTQTWLALRIDRRAVTALEYGLIADVIVATITIGFSVLANSLSQCFSATGDNL